MEELSGMVGMPEGLYLHRFGAILQGVFGATPYHVGSSVTSKKWRDVDVRVLLDEKEWKRWGFGDPRYCHARDARWVGLCMAFSELGRTMTGLPVDFQVQPVGYANERFKGPRSALGGPWK